MNPAAALAIAVALPFCASLALFALPNRLRDAATLLAGLTTLAVVALLASALPAVLDGAVLRIGWPWLPLPGAGFGFRADGLSLVFALLVAAIGALVILYARYYLDPQDPAARFHAFFMLFMGAMLGLVLARNLLLLATFWELTSLASFLLIGYWSQREDARRGARLALTITAAGGLALLGGVLLLGHIAGSYDLDVVLAAGETIRAHPAYLPMLLLVLLGAFAKSAQFPLHFWLPQAMAAPTPVSAYLHSATMVKAGVFLLARLHPAIAGTDAWFGIVTSVGLATLVVGAWSAIYQHDLKGLLAYSTISHLGLITLLLGLDTPLASVAAVFHLLNHATFKAALFMAAGIIDHECGTRDMRRINGLSKYMPVTATLAIAAAAAMAGVPLLNGFLSKGCSSPRRCRSGRIRSPAWSCPWSRRWPRRCRSPTRRASSTTCSGTASRVTCHVRRTSRRSGWRCPRDCWPCSACWSACCRTRPSPACWRWPRRRSPAASCPTIRWRSGTASTCRWR